MDTVEAQLQELRADILALQLGLRNTDLFLNEVAKRDNSCVLRLGDNEPATGVDVKDENNAADTNPSPTSVGNEVNNFEICSDTVTQESSKFAAEVPMMYQLRESVWDASVWILFVPWLESLVTACMMMLNILVQGYFCFLVADNLGQVSDIHLHADDLEGYLTWRITAAHHIKHFDEITNTSLASRVCSQWSAATASYDQMQIVEAFDSYLGSDTGVVDVILGGSGLCVLALLCWFFLVAADVCDNLEFMRALFSCSAESWTATSVVLEPYEITSLSRVRLCALVSLVALPRLAVSFTLFVTGARFLCYTPEIADLILNAIALGFIMEMDEAIFAFLPGRVRNAIQESAPMRMRGLGKFSGDMIRPCFVFLVGAAMVFCWEFIMSDVVTRMKVAQDLMCGGNLEFVYALDPGTGVVSMGVSDSLPFLDKSAYKFQAVLQGTELDHDVMFDLGEIVGFDDSWMPGDDVLMFTSAIEDVQEINEMSAAESLEVLMCEDLDEYPQYQSRLRDFMDDANISCSALVHNCTLMSVRMFCPRTCGCDTTLNGIYMRTGCSGQCDVLALAELASVSSKLFGSSVDKCFSDAPDEWQATFTADMQGYLVDVGSVTDRYLWSTAFQNSFADRSFGDYYLSNPSFDVAAWVNSSRLCDSISLLDGLFGTTLCDTKFESSLGTLQALCPNECGLCDAVSGVTSVQLSLLQLYDAQTEALDAGVIQYNVFEFNASNSKLTCGSVTSGTTVGANSTYGSGSPEKLYTFTSLIPLYVVVSTCSAADFDTVLRVYDSEWQQQSENDDFPGCDDYSSKLIQQVEAGGNLNILVEGYNVASMGRFELSLECCTDKSDCDFEAAYYYYYYANSGDDPGYENSESVYDGYFDGNSTSSNANSSYDDDGGVYNAFAGGNSTSSLSSGFDSSSNSTDENTDGVYTANGDAGSTNSTAPDFTSEFAYYY